MSEHDQSANPPMEKLGHQPRRPLNEGFNPRQEGDSEEKPPKQKPVGRK